MHDPIPIVKPEVASGHLFALRLRASGQQDDYDRRQRCHNRFHRSPPWQKRAIGLSSHTVYRARAAIRPVSPCGIGPPNAASLAGSASAPPSPLRPARPLSPPRIAARLPGPPRPLPPSPAPRPARLPALSAHLPASPPPGEGVLRIRGRLVNPPLRLLLRLVVPSDGPELFRLDPLAPSLLRPPRHEHRNAGDQNAEDDQAKTYLGFVIPLRRPDENRNDHGRIEEEPRHTVTGSHRHTLLCKPASSCLRLLRIVPPADGRTRPTRPSPPRPAVPLPASPSSRPRNVGMLFRGRSKVFAGSPRDANVA